MKNNQLLLSGINGFLVAQFLFFIDEGYYDFRWMSSLGNWLVFIFYFAVLFGLFLGINRLLKRFTTNILLLCTIDLIVLPLLFLTVLHYT